MLLGRAPVFLRVVVDAATGAVDALDQRTDVPAAGERIHVYRRRGAMSMAHLCYRGKLRHLSGFYAVAEYDYLPDVDGELMRDTDVWREWCQRQPAVK